MKTSLSDPGLLMIDRKGKHAPRLGRAAVAGRVALWNLLAPPGTQIRWFPVWGRWAVCREDTIHASASILPSGEPVLWLENQSGCISAWHAEPLSVEVAPKTDFRAAEEQPS